MPENYTDIIYFLEHFEKVSQESGYAFVYDVMALMQKLIPCDEINITIAKSYSNHSADVKPGTKPMWIASEFMSETEDLFYTTLEYIPYVKWAATTMMDNLINGDTCQPLTCRDYHVNNEEDIGWFYKRVGVKDVMSTAGLLDRNQFIKAKQTEGYYNIFIVMVRSKNSNYFHAKEKALFDVMFRVFLSRFREKINGIM